MIGIFDSGHGGLTILRAAAERLPARTFIYLGDHANAPYGERGPEEIYALTVANVERLFALGCRLVLLACNTAAAVALRRLQQTWLPEVAPERRVLGVLVPTVEAVTQVPWHVKRADPRRRQAPSTVGIFATWRTVESGAYAYEVGLRAPEIRVVEQPCPGLVAEIESGAPDSVLRPMIAGFTADLLRRTGGTAPDSVILGCTHYPLVATHFVSALPAGVRLIEQPRLVADSLADYLARHPEFDALPGGARRVRLLTSGSPERVGARAGRLFGAEVTFDSL